MFICAHNEKLIVNWYNVYINCSKQKLLAAPMLSQHEENLILKRKKKISEENLIQKREENLMRWGH